MRRLSFAASRFLLATVLGIGCSLAAGAAESPQRSASEANAGSDTASDAVDARQFYEVRSYVLGDKGDSAAIDRYLRDALIPALERQGVGPIGAFTNAPEDKTGSERIVVVIPYADPNEMVAVQQAVEADSQYQSDAEEYLSRGPRQPPYERIQGELLRAMQCMKQLNVPEGTLENSERVYELRIYESANERLGNLKVEMFNAGEVPIFLDSGIQPIFIGQCVVGPHTPSLTYLTVYENEQARGKAWQAFREHPDWKVLSKVPKYRGTVSRIHKYVLDPKPYSQM